MIRKQWFSSILRLTYQILTHKTGILHSSTKIINNTASANSVFWMEFAFTSDSKRHSNNFTKMHFLTLNVPNPEFFTISIFRAKKVSHLNQNENVDLIACTQKVWKRKTVRLLKVWMWTGPTRASNILRQKREHD